MEVHPPHQSIHTWRDFFIHIATIVVGLLIAIGLEQTVEWLHRLHEAKETREALKQERELNIQNFHSNVRLARFLLAEEEGNLRVFTFLQQHPGTSQAKLPGVVDWGSWSRPSAVSAWRAAEQGNSLALLSADEVNQSRRLYDLLAVADARELEFSNLVRKAAVYQLSDSDVSKLTPKQVDAEVEMVRDCLQRVLTFTGDLNWVAQNFVDFAPGPSRAELNAHRKNLPASPQQAFPEAYAYNKRDFDAAGKLDDADADGIAFTKALKEGDKAHADRLYAEFRKDHPQFKPDETVLTSWGYQMLEDGKLREAVSLLQLNVSLYPNSSNAYDSLGDAYRKQGDKAQAIVNYEKALQLEPDSENSKRKLDALRR